MVNSAAFAPFRMEFDIGAIKHLGLQMYSTLPPVIAELVANAWDADATRVDISVPDGEVTNGSVITVCDDGAGMSDGDVRSAYLKIGRDRRRAQGDVPTPKYGRRVMGRKGIGKFSAFGVANEIEVETIQGGQISHLRINYRELEGRADQREVEFPQLPPSGTVKLGTKITLRDISKFRQRKINLNNLRRGLARRFAVIGPSYNFEVVVNGDPITLDERDLKLILDTGADGKPYLWEYKDEEIEKDSPWRVSGWIGALKRSSVTVDQIGRGIAIMARGKLVQEPFHFDAEVGQQFALAYLIGELTAEFVDAEEDTVATTRTSLGWDTERNQAFKRWGVTQVRRISREWSERRGADNEAELAINPIYERFLKETESLESSRTRKVVDRFIKQIITRNPLLTPDAQGEVVQLGLDFMRFDAFLELADAITDANIQEPTQLLALFREWELIEAKEMMRVTQGRIRTIERLENLIQANALEVPTLHNFLREFPWVLDPRWSLVADEVRYSDLLRKQFPEKADVPEEERRIDFLCVTTGPSLIVVEIKRPQSVASRKEFSQIEDYVLWMRGYVGRTTDPSYQMRTVVGYLLCGDTVRTPESLQKIISLERDTIYIRRYQDLLSMVKAVHAEFLDRYKSLRISRLSDTLPPPTLPT
jgi:hypothetical protein